MASIRGLARADNDRPLLTPRQLECLRWVAAGESAGEIGRILNLSEHTVNEHLQAARRRLGVRTTTQAVMEASARNLLRLDLQYPQIWGVFHSTCGQAHMRAIGGRALSLSARQSSRRRLRSPKPYKISMSEGQILGLLELDFRAPAG